VKRIQAKPAPVRTARPAVDSPRKRRSDGERSRQAILMESAALASVIGLEGLSIGVLAERLGISKSGLYAHFGSKEELELATIDAARAIFDAEVLAPSLSRPPGLARVRGLCELFLTHVERRTFPGGCFFAAVAAEFDSRTGPVRDHILAFLVEWNALFERLVREAQALSEIDPKADAAQVTFEIHAMLGAANARFVMSGDARTLAHARAGVAAVLARNSGKRAASAKPIKRSR